MSKRKMPASSAAPSALVPAPASAKAVATAPPKGASKPTFEDCFAPPKTISAETSAKLAAAVKGKAAVVAVRFEDVLVAGMVVEVGPDIKNKSGVEQRMAELGGFRMVTKVGSKSWLAKLLPDKYAQTWYSNRAFNAKFLLAGLSHPEGAEAGITAEEIVDVLRGVKDNEAYGSVDTFMVALSDDEKTDLYEKEYVRNDTNTHDFKCRLSRA